MTFELFRRSIMTHDDDESDDYLRLFQKSYNAGELRLSKIISEHACEFEMKYSNGNKRYVNFNWHHKMIIHDHPRNARSVELDESNDRFKVYKEMVIKYKGLLKDDYLKGDDEYVWNFIEHERDARPVEIPMDKKRKRH